jgi:hypothetical protein
MRPSATIVLDLASTHIHTHRGTHTLRQHRAQVSGDPRVAFVHNLVTAEEAEELKSSASIVGLKQSLVSLSLSKLLLCLNYILF